MTKHKSLVRGSAMKATAVKEKPILFSAEMVRAILDDRKTMTRRIVKPQPPEYWSPMACERYTTTKVDRYGEECEGPMIFGAYDEDWGVACPYGGPGDRLWVRETWKDTQCDRANGTPIIRYRADLDREPDGAAFIWRPSIHMPRWASRITLEITDVRVEKLGDISEADAEAEGVGRRFEIDIATFVHGSNAAIDKANTYRIGFKHLWKEINGEWDPETWVWALTFKRCEAQP